MGLGSDAGPMAALDNLQGKVDKQFATGFASATPKPGAKAAGSLAIDVFDRLALGYESPEEDNESMMKASILFATATSEEAVANRMEAAGRKHLVKLRRDEKRVNDKTEYYQDAKGRAEKRAEESLAYEKSMDEILERINPLGEDFAYASYGRRLVMMSVVSLIGMSLLSAFATQKYFDLPIDSKEVQEYAKDIGCGSSAMVNISPASLGATLAQAIYAALVIAIMYAQTITKAILKDITNAGKKVKDKLWAQIRGSDQEMFKNKASGLTWHLVRTHPPHVLCPSPQEPSTWRRMQ